MPRPYAESYKPMIRALSLMTKKFKIHPCLHQVLLCMGSARNLMTHQSGRQCRNARSKVPGRECPVASATAKPLVVIPTKKKKRSAGSSDLFVGRNSETHTQVTRGVGTTNTHGSGRERFSAAKPHQPWTRDPRPRPVGVTTALTSQANVQNAQLADRSGRDWTHSEEAAVAL